MGFMFTLRAVFRLNHLIKLMSDVSFTLCIGSLQESRQTEQKMEKQTKWEEIESFDDVSFGEICEFIRNR